MPADDEAIGNEHVTESGDPRDRVANQLEPGSSSEVVLVDPRTGEIAETAAQVIEIHRHVVEQVAALQSIKRLAESALVRLSTERGQRTFRVGRHEVSIGRKTEIVWDMEILERLRAAGLPTDRWEELVQERAPKVRAVVARQLAAANPLYADIVDAARTDIDGGPTVTVT